MKQFIYNTDTTLLVYVGSIILLIPRQELFIADDVLYIGTIKESREINSVPKGMTYNFLKVASAGLKTPQTPRNKTNDFFARGSSIQIYFTIHLSRAIRKTTKLRRPYRFFLLSLFDTPAPLPIFFNKILVCC